MRIVASFNHPSIRGNEMTKQSFLPRLWERDDEPSQFQPFHSLQREIDRLFERFTGRDLSLLGTNEDNGHLVPCLDVRETDTDIEITTEMPGVEEKDIDVTVEEDMLSIRGEKKTEREESDDGYKLSERTFGTFERKMKVPRGVDADKIEAKLAKGVLSVTIPKPPESATNKRKIDVKAAA